MATTLDFAQDSDTIKALVSDLAEAAAALLGRAAKGATPRELEEQTWGLVLGVGRTLLSASMARACEASTEADLEARGLGLQDVRLRLDRDYHATQMSTFGPVSFPLFAYRERRGAATITRTPARERLVPLLGRCRSTPLCLEWEARLGKDLPFRRAAAALGFFTHGAVREEDTTLAAHAVAVGSVIDRKWLYRDPEEIQRIARERATLDLTTGRPVLYLSQDAHAERRYTDETWNAAWKSMNGLRLWAIDRHTGETIHLGAEYGWGDCYEVGGIIEKLLDDGILPRENGYADGTDAQLTIVTDGLTWIENHVIAKLPWAVAVLDIYHALEHIGAFAAKVYGAGTKAANAVYRRLASFIAPAQRRREKTPTPRRGHKKGAAKRPKPQGVYGSGWALVEALHRFRAELRAPADQEHLDALVNYMESNAYRADYEIYRARGLQIGSGAMESLHRTAAQSRLKLAGARWTARTSLALVNLRLLDLVGRWDEFWRHDGLDDVIRPAFGNVG